ncbi:8645_t:CDS:2, partial [Racocetra persica]
MSRFIFLLLIFIGFTSAQLSTINTPSNRVAIGASIPITWQYTPQANQRPGTLSVIDNATKNTTIIDSAVNLTAQSYTWKVSVPMGTYYLALNDGTGDKASSSASTKANTPPAQMNAATSFIGIAVGATVPITWQYTPQTNPLPGTLSVIDNTTKNTTTISGSINLSAKNYQWTVNVAAGMYYLGLNDGSGDKYSGTFEVFSTGSSGSPSSPQPTTNSPSGSSPNKSGAAP